METFSWIQIKFVGEQPSARQGHSITFFPKARRLFLFGGLDASGAVVKDKAYFLSVPHDLSERWQWQPVRLAGLSRTIGGIMVDRAFHSTSDIGNEKIVVFGGICDEITSKHHSSMLFQCDTASFSCHEPKAYGEGPCSRYAHSSCSLESGANGREVIIIGGMKSDTREILCDGFVLEVHPTAVRWSKINFQGDLLSKFSVAFHTVSPVTAGLMAQGNILLFGGKSEKNKKCSTWLSLYPSTHNYSAVSSPTLLARVRTAKDFNGNKFTTRQDFLRQRQDREKMAKAISSLPSYAEKNWITKSPSHWNLGEVRCDGFMPKHRAGHSAVMLARRYLVVCFGMDMKSRASSEAYLIDCKPEEKIEPRVREAKVYPPVSSDGPSASSAAEILNFAEDNGPGGLQEEEEAVENATQDRTLHMEDISDTAVVKMSGPSQAEHFKNVLRRICSEIQKGGNFFDLVNMMGEAGILTASQGRKLLFLANQCDTRVLQAFTALENTPGEERTLDMIKEQITEICCIAKELNDRSNRLLHDEQN